MTTLAVRERVADLLGTILGRPVLPGEVVVRADEPRWDSIRHLELVFALEDAFDVRFDGSELPALDSLASIIRHLESHLAA